MSLKHIFILMCQLSICGICLGSREPQCSQYHFLEQLLDKMIRGEVKVEALQKHVDDSLTEMRATLETYRAEMDKDREAYSTMIAQQKVEVQNAVLSLQTIKDKSSQTPVVFLARDLANRSVGKGQKYVFTTIIYNHGDGYDGSSGVFIAPQDGLYMFTISVCVIDSSYACVNFVVNGESMSRAAHYSSGAEPCNSLQLAILLTTDDAVWVESTYDTSHTKTDYYRWNALSGALIQTY